MQLLEPGPVVLIGSGETSPTGRKIFERVFRALPPSPQVALLETPAGFELNSAQVVGRVVSFLEARLRNYSPQVQVVPARRRGSPESPDDPQVTRPLLDADLLFMGPGSPSYAVRQLQGSLAWHRLLARHRLGAALVFASAAVVALSDFALPVYEIYKVGEDLHWKQGLDFFAPFGLNLVLVPHWNNRDGGEELDTNRCFMGRPRFERLLEMLPAGLAVLGIDENTALTLDLARGICQVGGLGNVTLLPNGREDESACLFASGQEFALSEIGPFRLPPPAEGIPPDAWEEAVAAREAAREAALHPGKVRPPGEVLALVEQREQVRRQKDWAGADAVRARLAAQGWSVVDTPHGPQVNKI